MLDYEAIKEALTFYAATAETTRKTKTLLDAVDAIEELTRTLKDCRNELCLQCGAYKQRHMGTCDGCRWLTPPKGGEDE